MLKIVFFITAHYKILDFAALWAIVNNAGITLPWCPFEWLNRQDFLNVFNVNILGSIDVTLAFLPLLRRGKEGKSLHNVCLSDANSSFTCSRIKI